MKDKEYKNIKLPESDGMTVPEGYFDQFAFRMVNALPDRPELHEGESVLKERTLWQRVRPYVYMAAMFAGVWLMLKMFTMMTSTGPMSLDSDPVVAEALSNDDFVNDYVISDLSQWDIYDSLIENGVNPEAFLDSVALAEMDVPDEYIN